MSQLQSAAEALRRPVVAGVVVGVIVLAAAWWFLLMSPQESNLNNTNGKIATLSSQYSSLVSQVNIARENQANAPTYAHYLSLFSSSVPAVPETTQLVTQLGQLGDMTNVKITSISDDTAVPVAGSPLGQITLTLNVEGSRTSVVKFVTDMYDSKDLPRLVTISTLVPAPKASGQIQVNILKKSNAQFTAQITGLAYYDSEVDPPLNSIPSVTTTTVAG